MEGTLRRYEISHDDHALSLGSKSVWHQSFQFRSISSIILVGSNQLSVVSCVSNIVLGLLESHKDVFCFSRRWQDTELAEQINRDVKRMHPDMQFFCGDNNFARENQVCTYP